MDATKFEEVCEILQNLEMNRELGERAKLLDLMRYEMKTISCCK
jgi:hypothetical protein